MSSRPPTLTNTIHLRGFVDGVVKDSTRTDPDYIEIRTDVNISEEDRFYSSNVIVDPIPTRIRAYVPHPGRDIYVPNAFFYADGRFTTTITYMTIAVVRLEFF